MASFRFVDPLVIPMKDIFLSYSRSDRARVSPLVTALRNHGYTVAWDRDFLAGIRWRGAIPMLVQSARCVVAVWSESGKDSLGVPPEVEWGLERDVLVTIRIDEVKPPYPFTEITYLDFFDTLDYSSHSDWALLIESIEAKLNHSDALVAEAPPDRLVERRAIPADRPLSFNPCVSYIDRKAEQSRLDTAIHRRTNGGNGSAHVIAVVTAGDAGDWHRGLALRFQWQPATNGLPLKFLPKVDWPEPNERGADNRRQLVRQATADELCRAAGLDRVGDPLARAELALQELFKHRNRIVIDHHIPVSRWRNSEDSAVVTGCLDWWGQIPIERADGRVVLLFSVLKEPARSLRERLNRMLASRNAVLDAFDKNFPGRVEKLNDSGLLGPVTRRDMDDWPETLVRNFDISESMASALHAKVLRHLDAKSSMRLRDLMDRLAVDQDFLRLCAED